LETIETFFKENYPQLKRASKNITKNHELSEELLHFVIEDFLCKKTSHDVILSGGGVFYLVRMLITNWNSKTSPFYTKNIKNSTLCEEISYELEDPSDKETEQEETKTLMYEIAKRELDQLHWYDRELFLLYIDQPNISQLARDTGIPRTSISLSINRIKSHLKSKLNRI
jgi:hypothetical protein